MGKSYFGYKNHLKADSKTKLITAYKVTAANTHDSEVMEELLSKQEDAHQPLYADSAYRSEAIEQSCMDKQIISRIHQKGYRNNPLTKAQQKSNQRKSKWRARVEHLFGFMTNSMNGMYLHYRSLLRNTAAIGLINLTYNLFRLVQLRVVVSN